MSAQVRTDNRSLSMNFRVSPKEKEKIFIKVPDGVKLSTWMRAIVLGDKSTLQEVIDERADALSSPGMTEFEKEKIRQYVRWGRSINDIAKYANHLTLRNDAVRGLEILARLVHIESMIQKYFEEERL
jgi:urease gamma subunit